MGLAAALVYVTLGRRRIDYRFVLIGAALPDVTDGLLQLFGVFESASGRGMAHSLTWVIAEAIIIILALRGELRLAVFGIAVGWLTHLVADGIWDAPKTLLWPAFGNSFEATPAEPYSWNLLGAPLAHWTTWAGEAVGAAILAWFYVAFRLGEDNRLRLFLSDGYLRP